MGRKLLLWAIALLILIIGVLVGILLAGDGIEDAPGGEASGGNSSTTVPDTTVAPSNSTAPETTTTMAPGSGVIVASGGIAGWFADGQWRSLLDGPPPAVPGEAYQIVRVGEPVSTAIGGAVTEGCEFVEPSADVDGLIDFDDFPDYPIAVAADWEVVPRPVELLSTDNPTYQAALTDLLAGKGIVDPAPELRQVIRTDLEGDGSDEIIITAGYDGPFFPAVPAGSYSVAVLRKVVAGEVQSAILGFQEVPAEGEPTSFLEIFRITAIADLNGDGKMEVVVDASYFEGGATTVYDYVNDDLGPVPVLGVGCGV